MLKVNEYFDGNVKSIAYVNSDGPATVGVMAVGDYKFATSSVEVMTVISGSLNVLLPTASQWCTYTANQFFEVAKDKEFLVKVTEETVYICYYK